VPVYSGSRKPFCRDVVHAESIHGETGLDGTTVLPKPVAVAQRNAGGVTGAMRDALMACAPGTAWLVTTGTLTNAALLFSVYPELTEHIAGLSIMGGAIGNCFTYAPMGRILTDRIVLRKDLHKIQPSGLPSASNPAELVAQVRSMGIIEEDHKLTDEEILAFVNHNSHNFGNWSAYAEFNILADPESASAIFSNENLAAKTTLVTLDLTHQVLGTSSIMELINFGRPSHQPEEFQYPESVIEGSRKSKTSRNGNTSVPSESEPTRSPTLVRKLFHEILSFFAATYASEFAMHSGPPVHDPLAMFAALAPALFDDNDGERFEVTVIREDNDGRNDSSDVRREQRDRDRSSQCGRTVIKPARTGVRIPRAVESGVFWNLIDFALEKAEVLKASQK
jgi:uridine nucleosidase